MGLDSANLVEQLERPSIYGHIRDNLIVVLFDSRDWRGGLSLIHVAPQLLLVLDACEFAP